MSCGVQRPAARPRASLHLQQTSQPPKQNGPGGILRGRRSSRVYFVAAAFFAVAATAAFGFQNDRSSVIQLSGSRLIAGVNTNKFDTVLL